MTIRHVNTGKCPKCEEIKNRYPGFDQDMWTWFKLLQASHPEAHISCAGRDEHEQNILFGRGASKAKWGQSAHNYNAALDLFVILPGSTDIYPVAWFNNVLAPLIPHFIQWYGAPGSKFFELPHVEKRQWRDQVIMGKLTLVNSQPKVIV